MRLALCSWSLATGLRMASTTPQKAARRQATAAGTPAKRPKTSPHFRKGAFPPAAQSIMNGAGPTIQFPAWANPPAPPAPLWLPLARANRAAVDGGLRRI